MVLGGDISTFIVVRIAVFVEIMSNLVRSLFVRNSILQIIRKRIGTLEGSMLSGSMYCGYFADGVPQKFFKLVPFFARFARI
jgi:hypothetical protein